MPDPNTGWQCPKCQLVHSPLIPHCACCVEPQPQQGDLMRDNAHLEKFRKHALELGQQQTQQRAQQQDVWLGHNFGDSNGLAACLDCGYNRIAQPWRPCGVMRQ